MTEEEKRSIALFRFGVIGELVSRTDLSWGEREGKIRELARREWTIPGSQRTRVARSTIHEWLGRYAQSGRQIESLFPRDRSDAGRPRSIDEETELALVNLKREVPRVSLPSLLAMAQRRNLIGSGFGASAQSVYRMFKRHGLSEPSAVDGQEDRRRFEAEYPNELWQTDCMHGPTILVDGKPRKAYLFGLIDDHSRLITHAQFYLQENIDSFQDCLIQALEKRGLPRKLFCDNGPSFRSERLRYGCAALGVALIYAKPYSPASKGKIERLWKTIRMQVLQRLPDEPVSLGELNRRLQRWIEEEYHARPHGSTGMAPVKRFLQHIELVRPAPKNLRDSFRKPVYRNVERNTRTVSLHGKLYEAPTGLAGKRVLLLYHEQDPERIEVICENRSQGFLTPLNPGVNSRVRRKSGRDIELLPPEKEPDQGQRDPRDPRYRDGQLFGPQEQS